MYYGNPSVANQEDVTNVWDANYVGVWHLDETPSDGGTHADSTSNSNTGIGEDDDGLSMGIKHTRTRIISPEART